MKINKNNGQMKTTKCHKTKLVNFIDVYEWFMLKIF